MHTSKALTGAALALPMFLLACNGGGEIKAPAGMVYAKPGKFNMGYDGEGATPAEKPIRSVSTFAEKGFFIDTYEVTNADFLAYCEGGTPVPSSIKKLLGPDGKLPEDKAKLPVVGVTYNEAEAYAKAQKKRLPTEEEWEYAARSAASMLFPWGPTFEKGKANTFEEGKGGPVPVGSYVPGPFGAFDQAGNVWEWTSTPAQPGGSAKVIKGGSFAALEPQPRSSLRGTAEAGERRPNLGFRCAKDIPQD